MLNCSYLSQFPEKHCLFLAIIYDGIFLMLLLMFEDYPLENFALISTLLNPIDMGRVLIIFQLDFGALMGYDGAIFKKFFGSSTRTIIIFSSFLIWCLIPFGLLLRVVKRKYF
jgi:Cu-processing system permease protein